MIRRIAAHYYLNEHGEFVKFPIISFVDGIITKIESYTILPEIAGLEFYSGSLLPLFIDVIAPKSLDELVKNCSFRSPLISKVVIDELTFCGRLTDLTSFQQERIMRIDKEMFLSLKTIYDENLSVFNKINWMVNSKQFTSQHEGIKYFTYGLTRILGVDNHSRISEGARAEFILCSDLGLVKLGHANEDKFRRLA